MTSFARVSKTAYTLWTVEDHVLNRVQFSKRGKCTGDYNFFGRNNVCHHCLAIGIHLICVAIIVKAYGSQNMSNISAATTPKNARVKVPFRKRSLPESEALVHHSLDKDMTSK